MNILFPGRHLVNTKFQKKYLIDLINKNLEGAEIIGDAQNIRLEETSIDNIIFAVTSSNQSNSRYNPIDYEKRILGVDRFGQSLREYFPELKYRIIGIPDFGRSKRFPEFTIKEIYEQTGLEIDKCNTLVLCSTPEVIELYQNLGFRILPAELDANKKTYTKFRPAELVQMIAESNNEWQNNPELVAGLAESSTTLLKDFPEIVQKIVRIYNEPLLNDEGNLTNNRNYDIYNMGMANNDIIKIKYNDIKNIIIPGKIVDEGCADGALLMEVTKDFEDSDLIGVDISAEFIARAEENKRASRFGKGTYVHFHQRNIMNKIFSDDSIDTVISNSTGHEIWSYGDNEPSVDSYLKNKYLQLRKNGRLIMRDVIGPENKEEKIYMYCSKEDGNNGEPYKEYSKSSDLSAHLKKLSTHARFLRFAKDFRKTREENPVDYVTENIGNKEYFILKHKDAVEFMTKKDYCDNWNSEMNEEFAFWDFNEWKQHLKNAGFKIIENPNDKQSGSRVYTNQWIVDNRWKNSVELYRRTKNGLEQMPYPPTNTVLVGEKS